MNLIKTARELLLSIFSRITGIKILVMDQETIQIISLIISQSDLLEKEFFLSELIDNPGRTKLSHFNGVYFLRPNNENISIICNELENPLFKDYYIFFTNTISPNILQKFAMNDHFDVIRKIQEIRLDIEIVNKDLFSLNMNYSATMYNLPTNWTTYEETLFSRIIDGLYSICCIYNKIPYIRYPEKSALCRNISFALERRLLDSHPIDLIIADEFSIHEKSISTDTIMLILDRRNDPVTPLLTQWTYQAMLHELLGITLNKIKIDENDIIVSGYQDPFFEKHLLTNFGELGFSIRNLISSYEENTKKKFQLESIEDMHRFAEMYPEFKKNSSNVYKHVTLVYELSKIIENRKLMDISLTEQDIVMNDNISEHTRQVGELITDTNISSLDKLRLVMLYALRYQDNELLLNNFKYYLQSDSKYVDGIIDIANKNIRSYDLFHNRTLLSMAKSTIQRSNNNSNIYLQHKTLLYYTLEQLVKGKLKLSSFPCTNDNIPNKKPTDIIIFIVGGATYEEARDIEIIKKLYDIRIILGGTTFHNSKSFISDLELAISNK
ncbi:Sec1 family protein [Cryptosporidium muris RN66]|uniref:Sec1 family protein n=1 Tax=Cryptosporidium muris (strain RN66) TaxID=441375 RepID=B6A938_CRYMR|nr:Sec1 family protein [Cryptosporidium muris RN66]EEA04729.1 Sec1 family protein [Cryptosporidium muris RN66]|eukprot:XP_002139078.1 Sec1 family protein [Cryptosporidium muris RN66]